jgi:hypothetical protein
VQARQYLSLDFSYKRDNKDILCDSVSPNLSNGAIGVFLSIQDQLPSFFPQCF